jgi:transposase-like protein
MNEPVIQSKKIRKKFDKVFKQYAVELWLNSGRAATEVAAELGFHAQRLSAWRKRTSSHARTAQNALVLPHKYRFN